MSSKVEYESQCARGGLVYGVPHLPILPFSQHFHVRQKAFPFFSYLSPISEYLEGTQSVDDNNSVHLTALYKDSGGVCAPHNVKC